MTVLAAPVGAGIYHRPSRDWLLVTAVHRDPGAGVVCGYALFDTYRRIEYPHVVLDQVDLARAEVPGITVIWRDLKPGMAICWEDPDQLDVLAVSDPDRKGWCVIDAVQGRFPAVAANLFTQITPALADLVAAIVIEESEQRR